MAAYQTENLRGRIRAPYRVLQKGICGIFRLLQELWKLTENQITVGSSPTIAPSADVVEQVDTKV